MYRGKNRGQQVVGHRVGVGVLLLVVLLVVVLVVLVLVGAV